VPSVTTICGCVGIGPVGDAAVVIGNVVLIIMVDGHGGGLIGELPHGDGGILGGKRQGVGGKICIDKGSRAQRIGSDFRGGLLHTVGHGIAVAEGVGQVPGDAAGIINSLVSRVVDEAGKLVAVHDGVGHPECLDAVIEIPEIAVGMDINSVLGCGGDLAAAG
jgi:hypothetical protein